MTFEEPGTIVSEQPRDTDTLDLLEGLVRDAVAAGAEAADAVLARQRALSVSCRLGAREALERADGAEVGLRVFVGRRQGLVSTSNLSARSLEQLVERSITMVRRVPEDPFCGLAEPGLLVGEPADVGSYVPDEPSIERLTERALRAEAAALKVKGVTNSEGSEAAAGTDEIAIVATNGLARTFRRSWHSASASVLAGSGTAMQRDYEYATAVREEDLPSPETLGRSAGERTVRRLGPRKARTAVVPVVYEPRAARSLLGHLAAAINGAAVARGTTFLKDKLGEAVFAEGVSIIDDPLRRGGLRSRPFDGEGIPARALSVVDGGRLTCWLTDLASARQLGIETTGRAARGPSSLPSPSATNLYLEPGPCTPEALIGEIEEGFYVTELIGFGINGVTGDYSRGAIGFWVTGGQFGYPVSEVTVSGNLNEMFARLTPANDLIFRYGIDSPTLRIDGMTVAGR